MRRRRASFLGRLVLASLLAASLLPTASGAFIDVISRDFQALTRKVTARHILLPKSREVALALKQSIRNRVAPPRDSDAEPMYVEDAFAAAAAKYSRDEATASDGGLLGTLVPQGYCRARELDEACFQVPLGEICGPVESEYGYHLLLVTERTNCRKLDGPYTKISRGADGVSKVLAGNSAQEGREQMTQVALQQVGFWIGVSLAGGVVAEIAAKTAHVIETLPWE
ncbi:hypothetical protein ACHAWF_001403 [Thalassiosira exigua]